jgi:hypothetical protein
MAQGQGIAFAQDFSLEKLRIITGTGATLDIKQLVYEFSYYEDIYSFVSSGFVTISDALGLIEKLQLTGNEIIEVQFDKSLGSGGTSGIKKQFRVYKIGPRTPSVNMTVEFYTLYFCSEELLLSEQSKTVRVFDKKPISEMVATILNQELRVPSSKFFVEPTTGLYDFVIPRMRPIEAISWLSNYARPSYNGGTTADLLFFENKLGYQFRSISNMMLTGRSKPYASYKYQASNLPDKYQTFQSDITTVLNFEVVKTHDMLEDIDSGTFSSRLISIDPLTRNFNVTDYNYNQDYKKRLNPNDAVNFKRNRKGTTQTQSPEGKLKLVVSNKEQNKVPFLNGSTQTLGEDIRIESFVPNRTAELSMANYNVLKITIPGDPNIAAGSVINFRLHTMTLDQNRDLDKFFSGNYLVNAVRHVIVAPSTYQTVLEIAKDSSIQDHADIDRDTAQNKSLSGFTDFYNNITDLRTGNYSTDADIQGNENFYGEPINVTSADADIQGEEDFYGQPIDKFRGSSEGD